VELAEALESRAFGASEKRTSIATLKMRAADIVAIFATCLGLALALYVYFRVPLPNIVIPIQMPRIPLPKWI